MNNPYTVRRRIKALLKVAGIENGLSLARTIFELIQPCCSESDDLDAKAVVNGLESLVASGVGVQCYGGHRFTRPPIHALMVEITGEKDLTIRGAYKRLTNLKRRVEWLDQVLMNYRGSGGVRYWVYVPKSAASLPARTIANIDRTTGPASL